MADGASPARVLVAGQLEELTAHRDQPVMGGDPLVVIQGGEHGQPGFGAIVYASLGVLCWLPRVERWAAQVGALVAPGGRFYVHDGHPLAWALADNRLEFEHPYFEEPEPLVDDSAYTYTDSEGPLLNTH